MAVSIDNQELNAFLKQRSTAKNDSNISILGANGSLLFGDIPVPVNPHHQGQYSSEIGSLSTSILSDIAYPVTDGRPPIKELTEMQRRDPVVSQCVSLKALRAVQSFGDYTHSKKEIETFVNSNLQGLKKSFKRTLFKIITSVILYGFAIAEYTFTSKARGFQGEWRLARLNVLNPEKIVRIIGKEGKAVTIEYDNGHGKLVKIPYSKCIHITNNSGANFDEDEIWGTGDGMAALNYYKLKRVVLTQLALATKNNSTGIIHVQVPNTGRTVLVNNRLEPIKGKNGKPVETTKQIALNYQLQDLYKKDYIVTDTDVELKRIQVQNNENFWEYVLNYIDRSIQRAFGVPVGIFDSGTGGVQNVGLSQNFKAVFDSTIYALTELLKEELIQKPIKLLLFYNFPFDWFKNNYGEFRFETEEDPQVVNSRLSTISSLIASGLLEADDPEILTLIKKNLGLPALDEAEKQETLVKKATDKASQELQNQLTELQTQFQMMQTQMQMQQLMNPPPPAPPEDMPEGA
jgi:hypothetical protein